MTSREFASRLTYPNPFRPSGIDFDLPGEALVTLQILDTAGLVIRMLLDNQRYSGGTHHVELFIDQDFRGSGGVSSRTDDVYYYRLSIEFEGKRYIDTKKIMFTV